MSEDHLPLSIRLSKPFREELIASEDPLRFRGNANGLLNVLNEIHVGTGIADQGYEGRLSRCSF